MQNIADNLARNPLYIVLLVVLAIVVVVAVVVVIRQWSLYRTLMLVSKVAPIIATAGLLGIVGVIGLTMQPYTPPAADTIALVIGNVQNSPKVKLTDEVAGLVSDTMAQHSGDDVTTLAESIVLVEASGVPSVVDINPDDLKAIGQNSANARTQLNDNIETINQQVVNITPDSSGANYLEAIITASNNVSQGASIVAIGSGLSDRGDLNFAGTNILTNEDSRNRAVNEVIAKYGNQYLTGYNIALYGLGDTTEPQAPLSNYQKQIVRDIYKDVITGLGGRVMIGRGTMSGAAVETNYTVNTTDTGCGNVEMTFDDDQVKFNPDKTTFVDEVAARESLQQAKDFYDQYSEQIQSIQIDGYTAHYSSRVNNLSQARADAVRQLLIDMGLPPEKLVATGRGYGPFEYNDKESNDDVDSKNRMIKLTIQRDAEECQA